MSMQNNGSGVSPKWANVIRALEASCQYNNGFAVVTMKIVVNTNSPVLWMEPTCAKLHPGRMAQTQMTPALAAALTAMLE